MIYESMLSNQIKRGSNERDIKPELKKRQQRYLSKRNLIKILYHPLQNRGAPPPMFISPQIPITKR